MSKNSVQIIGGLPPNKKFQFPDHWPAMCSMCKVMTLANFASENGLVISLFPAIMNTSRLQAYLHPVDVVLPFTHKMPRDLVSLYWVFSLEHLTFRCFCGENRKPSVEAGYFSRSFEL